MDDDVSGGAPSDFKSQIFSHNKQAHQSFLVYEISLITQAFNKVFLGDCEVCRKCDRKLEEMSKLVLKSIAQ